MRGLGAAVLTIFVSAPAWAGHAMMHDRIPLPPASPPFESSDGDRYGRFAKDYGPPRRQSDLERLATSIGAGRNGTHADLFKYSVSRDEYGNAAPQGAAIAGTFSNGAAELQFRWTTDE